MCQAAIPFPVRSLCHEAETPLMKLQRTIAGGAILLFLMNFNAGGAVADEANATEPNTEPKTEVAPKVTPPGITPEMLAAIAPEKTLKLLRRTYIWGDYRLRILRAAQDRVPALSPDSIDTSANHRLRLEVFSQLTPRFGAGVRMNTFASRLGDFNTATGSHILPRPQFDKLYLGYWLDDRTLMNIGRGPSRQYEADLVVGTGRFDEDDFNADSLTIHRAFNKSTDGYVIYSPTFTTNLLPPPGVAPRFTFQAYAIAFAKRFNDDTKAYFFGGSFDPRRASFATGGQKAYRQAVLRIDHQFTPKVSAFASGSFQFTRTNGFTFLDAPTASTGDRTGFFGGVQHGNADNLGENQFEFYYTKTGDVATSLLSEFPSGAIQYRVQWQKQIVKDIRLLASAVRNVNDNLPTGVTRNDTDTAYLQVYSTF